MSARFRFRFESGPRENEWITLELGTCSIGRLPKNTVQLTDSSVSGRHAELQVEADGVTLVDLGSTNGTRVEGERVESLLLGHGDRLQFGSIRAVFHDASVVGDAAEELKTNPSKRTSAAPSADAAAAPSAPHDPSRVSAEALARSGGGSKLGLALLGLIILGGGGFVAWSYLQSDGAEESTSGVELDQVPGNLLGDYSFEAESQWTSAEAASQAFFVDRSFALSGTFGLGVLLEGEEWGLSASEPVPLTQGQGLRLSGYLRTHAGALGRLGLELLPAAPDEPSLLAWAPALEADDFVESQLNFRVPEGIKAARVLVAARGGGGESEVSFDDLSLVQEGVASEPPLVYEEYSLSLLGSSATLSRSGRTLFTSISASPWSLTKLGAEAQASWSARVTQDGFILELEGASAGPLRCELLAGDSRPLSPDPSSPPYLASMGVGGYRSHALGFKRAEATHLLVGGGANLMRFSTGKETTLGAQNRAGQPLLTLDMQGSKELTLQLGFDQERGLAESLALKARSLAAEQRSGEALAAWSQLLAQYPIDIGLISEAEGVRTRLLAEGHARIEALETSLESADFFKLRDGYARCKADALVLGRDYQGTEIETKAQALVARIDSSMQGLQSGGQLADTQLIQGVLSALDSASAPALHERLNQALSAHNQAAEDPRK